MSEADDRIAVSRHFEIVGQQAQRFCQSLGDKHAVEGVDVQVGEMFARAIFRAMVAAADDDGVEMAAFAN